VGVERRRFYRLNRTWHDSSLHGGQDWWEEILRRITDCDTFIAIISRDALNSTRADANSTGPDLHAYLDDLLRTRERLLATTDLDDWARAEAMPSEEEIRRIRRLIDQIRNGLDELEPEQRKQLQQAVTVVRRHRSVMLGMPRTRQILPDLRPERTP